MTRAAALAELATALVRDPGLHGARCAGQPELVAGETAGETAAERTARHHRALALCRDCPASSACARIAGTLRARDRDGIWAGEAWNHGTRTNPMTTDPHRNTEENHR